MKANVRQYAKGKWSLTKVDTNPLTVALPRSSSVTAQDWAAALPPVMVEGKSTRFFENPKGWLKSMARMRYTRITVELLD